MATIVPIATVGTASSNANTATTTSVDTTGATALFVIVGFAFPGFPPVTDSKSNVYSLVGDYYSNVLDMHLAVYQSLNSNVGTGHTVTVTLPGSSPIVHLVAVKNTDAEGVHEDRFDESPLSSSINLPISAPTPYSVTFTSLLFKTANASVSGDTFGVFVNQNPSGVFGLATALDEGPATAGLRHPIWHVDASDLVMLTFTVKPIPDSSIRRENHTVCGLILHI